MPRRRFACLAISVTTRRRRRSASASGRSGLPRLLYRCRTTGQPGSPRSSRRQHRGGRCWPSSRTRSASNLGRVRYPVVLFDLDGTVVDTGAIILASMRHAAVTVLGRDYSDAQLLASVRGPGLEAPMHALDPDRVDELVRVYREHNEALHDTIGLCAGMDVVLEELKDRGHTLGIVTAKRRRTVDLAFARVPVEHLFDVVVAGD